jgi:hypothetical protein
MAPSSPLTDLVLSASSVADDLGYVALADLAKAIGNDALKPPHYRRSIATQFIAWIVGLAAAAPRTNLRRSHPTSVTGT